jgi:hypothetical protein
LLNETDERHLRPEFKKQMDKLRATLFKRVKPKVLNSLSVNKGHLVAFVKAILDHFNEHKCLEIKSAYEQVMRF